MSQCFGLKNSDDYVKNYYENIMGGCSTTTFHLPEKMGLGGPCESKKEKSLGRREWEPGSKRKLGKDYANEKGN